MLSGKPATAIPRTREGARRRLGKAKGGVTIQRYLIAWRPFRSMSPSDKQAQPEVNFDRLDEVLMQARAAVDASEGHGILCGLACVQSVVNPEDWEPVILGDTVLAGDALTEGKHLLAGLWRQSIQQLESLECAFDPLLPPDSRRLSLRTEGLASWCNGFLYGFGLGGGKVYDTLSGEATEFVQDLTNISRMDTRAQDNETDEAAYTEVLEYVRVGVLLIYEDLRQFRQLPGTDKVH